jgi:hypothetical protein
MNTYLRTFVLAAALAAACLISANLILDPYRIVHAPLGTTWFQPNSRVFKFEYLYRHCADYNTYIVGDSRAHILSESDFQNTSGLHIYNFASPRDEIISIVRRLKLLIRANCPISAILVGESVDILRYGQAPSLLDTESPYVSGESRVGFYGKFFFSSQPLIRYASQAGSDDPFHFAYYPDGHVDYLWRMKSPADFAATACRPPQLSASARSLLFEKLPAYRELADLAVRNRFRAIVWITPFNLRKSAVFDDTDVQSFLVQLRAIPHLSVIGPERQSPLLADFRAWTDCMHFRQVVFDELVAPAVEKLLVQ